MTPLTTVAAVRAKFGLPGPEHLPDAVIQRSIEDAHTELWPLLAPDQPDDPPADELVLGATLLSGARLFDALASREAYDQQRRVVGGQRVEESRRFASLQTTAARHEGEAWRLLAPFLAPAPRQNPGRATATTQILGGDGPCR